MSRSFLLLLLSALGALVLPFASAAAAPTAGVPFHIEQLKGFDPTLRRLSGTPPRTELLLAPGASTTFPMSFVNLTGRDVVLKLAAVDVEGRTDSGQFLALVDRARFGARTWLRIPDGKVRLRNGARISFNVTVRVPSDASPGSHYAAVSGSVDPVVDTGATSGASAILPTLGLQVFITIPGALHYGGRIRSADAPRLIQRGSSYLPVSLVYENTGNVSDEVGGVLELRSSFGNRVDQLPFEKEFFLRGSAREFRVLWTDPPWIGRFVPSITLVGKDGKERHVTLPAVYVIPPWYYLLAVALAIAFPFWWRWRDRRRIRRILAAAGVGQDEEFDEYDDEDDLDDEGH